MRIYAKASLDAGEIREKIRCGCDGIEYNLTEEFLHLGEGFEENYPEEIFFLKNVEAVHVPWINGQMMNMEHIFQHEDLRPIENVFRLAAYCADIWKHRMLVVIHSSLSMYDFMEYELFRRRLEGALGELFDRYPQVDMAIENVIPLEYKHSAEEAPRLCNGIFTDIPEIAGYLRERFGGRVGTVLDTCHAAMTEKYMTAYLKLARFLEPGEKERESQTGTWESGMKGQKTAVRERASAGADCAAVQNLDYSMEHYFRANQGICRLIHFNDFAGNGYRENHGTGFTSQEKVDGILDLYQKYGYDCPLTLEIREEDYEDCVNYRGTKALVENWMGRQKTENRKEAGQQT